MLNLPKRFTIDPHLVQEAFMEKLPPDVHYFRVKDLAVLEFLDLTGIVDRIMKIQATSTTVPQVARVSTYKANPSLTPA